MRDVLGVDIDGSIVSLPPQCCHTALTDPEFKACVVEAGCLRRLDSLATHGWKGRVYLFGVADETRQDLFTDWLKRSGFELSSIAWDHVLWPRTLDELEFRCRGLSITHFIGRNFSTLARLVEVVQSLYWFKPNPQECQAYRSLLSKVTIIENWRDAEDRLRHATLPLSLDARFLLRTRSRSRA